jgi:hypothetical protein
MRPSKAFCFLIVGRTALRLFNFYFYEHVSSCQRASFKTNVLISSPNVLKKTGFYMFFQIAFCKDFYKLLKIM